MKRYVLEVLAQYLVSSGTSVLYSSVVSLDLEAKRTLAMGRELTVHTKGRQRSIRTVQSSSTALKKIVDLSISFD